MHSAWEAMPLPESNDATGRSATDDLGLDLDLDLEIDLDFDLQVGRHGTS
jgi:hypothetical protein